MNSVFISANLAAHYPELLLFAAAFGVLGVDMIFRGKRALTLGLAGLAFAAALLLSVHPAAGDSAFPGMLAHDALARGSKPLLALCGLLSIALAAPGAKALRLAHAEFEALLLFAVGGMMLFAQATDLAMAFVALETFSLAMYVLAGFDRRRSANREAALKYFLIGAFAAAFFLFGMALLFGATGSVSIPDIGQAYATLQAGDPRKLFMMGGIGLVLVALAFKVGLAPFHLWAPDTYEGAPSPVTAFLGAGAKVAGFSALLRLAQSLPFDQGPLYVLIASLAVATMLMANLGALGQSGLKRLMAYSSVGHSGYALVGLAAAPSLSGPAIQTYLLVYTIMNFAVFALIQAAEEKTLADEKRVQGLQISEVKGLGFEKPVFAGLLAVILVSMAGLPPSAGFIAKLGVFRAAFESGHSLLVILAVINSVISAAYYLRVLVALYMQPKGAAASFTLKPSLGWVALAGAAALLVLGVLPSYLLALSIR